MTEIAAHEIEVRVRYSECDPMGVVHHSTYPVWFELGRTELLRHRGGSYRELEAQGYFLAVAKLEVRYHKPARYDDLLQLTTTMTRCGRAKIEHAYEVRRDDERLTSGLTTLACINRDGQIQEIPDTLLR